MGVCVSVRAPVRLWLYAGDVKSSMLQASVSASTLMVGSATDLVRAAAPPPKPGGKLADWILQVGCVRMHVRARVPVSFARLCVHACAHVCTKGRRSVLQQVLCSEWRRPAAPPAGRQSCLAGPAGGAYFSDVHQSIAVNACVCVCVFACVSVCVCVCVCV